MVGWHHRLDGHELEQAPGVSDGQVCCSPWGRKEWDTTERLNWTKLRLCWAYLQVGLTKVLSEWNSFLCTGLTVL